MHRQSASSPLRALRRLLPAVLLLVVATAGCVLQHPTDPATPGALAWYKSHTKAIDKMMFDVGTVTDPRIGATVEEIVAACNDLTVDAAAAARSGEIPSRTLQIQWAGALRYFAAAANLCVRSFDDTPAANATASLAQTIAEVKLRNAAYEFLGFGKVRLGTVVTALGGPVDRLPPAITPSTTATTVAAAN